MSMAVSHIFEGKIIENKKIQMSFFVLFINFKLFANKSFCLTFLKNRQRKLIKSRATAARTKTTL